MTPLHQFTADHATLLAAAAAAGGLTDPVAIDPDILGSAMYWNAVRGPLVPIHGCLVRDWSRTFPRYWPGVEFGARVYTLRGVRFVRVHAPVHSDLSPEGYDFVAVSRADYTKLFRLAKQVQRTSLPDAPPPVLHPATLETLRQHTVGFLDPKNLKRIKELGGRPKRGMLFTGPPGNGKTSACRWVLQQCTALGFETKQVGPDEYRAARSHCNPAAAVRELFRVTGRGVVFFDDMDLALRDRSASDQPEDQAVFLGALDGLTVNEGVVYVFTSNLAVERIDPAFRRPGRIDLVLPFPKPDATLRRELVGRWHPDVQAGLDADEVVADTVGYSFAEIEELKNLLVLRFTDGGGWDWAWAKRQFAENREDLTNHRIGLGFASAAVAANGNGKH